LRAVTRTPVDTELVDTVPVDTALPCPLAPDGAAVDVAGGELAAPLPGPLLVHPAAASRSSAAAAAMVGPVRLRAALRRPPAVVLVMVGQPSQRARQVGNSSPPHPSAWHLRHA